MQRFEKKRSGAVASFLEVAERKLRDDVTDWIPVGGKLGICICRG